MDGGKCKSPYRFYSVTLLQPLIWYIKHKTVQGSQNQSRDWYDIQVNESDISPASLKKSSNPAAVSSSCFSCDWLFEPLFIYADHSCPWGPSHPRRQNTPECSRSWLGCDGKSTRTQPALQQSICVIKCGPCAEFSPVNSAERQNHPLDWLVRHFSLHEFALCPQCQKQPNTFVSLSPPRLLLPGNTS